MNTNILKITAMVLFVITTIGREKNETHIGINSEVKGIDSEINITMVEVFDKPTRTLKMNFSTTMIYTYYNYPIDLSWKKSSDTIERLF